MRRTTVDLDDEALAAAAAELGTTTAGDTVNTALREIVEHRHRLRGPREIQEESR